MHIEKWEVHPFVGAGPLLFGSGRDEVRALLEATFTVFAKGDKSANDIDAFDDLGIHLFYNAKQELECIEFWGSVPVFVKGISALHTQLEDVLAKFSAVGISHRYDDGYILDGAGCALYAPSTIVEAVTAYRKGYYGNHVEGT
jgi:hypothetical protein